MKKSILLCLFICLGMSLTTYAQSDNAAKVEVKVDELTKCWTASFSGDGSATARGCFKFIKTKSGQINIHSMAKVEGDLKIDRPRLVFGFGLVDIDGTSYSVECDINPGLVITCQGEEGRLF